MSLEDEVGEELVTGMDSEVESEVDPVVTLVEFVLEVVSVSDAAVVPARTSVTFNNREAFIGPTNTASSHANFLVSSAQQLLLLVSSTVVQHSCESMQRETIPVLLGLTCVC